jgi:hypothetical protein
MRQELSVAAALVALACAQASATTIRVDQNGGGDYLTIQEGLDAASEGDTVLVAPGCYRGEHNRELDFGGTGVLLVSESAADHTIMDCEGAGRGFRFDSGEDSLAVVEGFTVRNAVADSGGGFLINGASPVIRGCVVIDCRAQYGGGICCIRDAAPKIEDCTLERNMATYGGAIYCEWGGSPHIVNSLIASNHVSENGGGLWLVLSTPSLFETTIDANSADGSGGGMGCWTHCNPFLMSCTIANNIAGDNGGGAYFHVSGGWLENVTLVGNSAYNGGGVYCFGSSPTLAGTIVSFSTEGEGIFCADGSQPYLRHCDIYGNAGGDALCGTNGGGNISEDPLFCDIWGGDFSLCANSACIEPLAPGGRIGRYGVGCSACTGTSVGEAQERMREPQGPTIYGAPNPFTRSTTVRFCLPEDSQATELVIYNLRGQKIRTLFSGAASAGRHTAVWDGRDDSGTPASSGIYFCALNDGGRGATARTVLVR